MTESDRMLFIPIGQVYAAQIQWPGNVTSIGELVTRILVIVYSVAGLLLFVLFVYGGFMWLTSTGDPERVRKATNTLVNAAIGIAIVVFAAVMTRVVSGVLGIDLLP